MNPTVSVVSQEPSIAQLFTQSKRMMTVKEVAYLLNVSQQTVLRQAKKGIIPHTRMGQRVLFCPKTVAVWLEKRMIGRV